MTWGELPNSIERENTSAYSRVMGRNQAARSIHHPIDFFLQTHHFSDQPRVLVFCSLFVLYELINRFERGGYERMRRGVPIETSVPAIVSLAGFAEEQTGR